MWVRPWWVVLQQGVPMGVGFPDWRSGGSQQLRMRFNLQWQGFHMRWPRIDSGARNGVRGPAIQKTQLKLRGPTWKSCLFSYPCMAIAISPPLSVLQAILCFLFIRAMCFVLRSTLVISLRGKLPVPMSPWIFQRVSSMFMMVWGIVQWVFTGEGAAGLNWEEFCQIEWREI